jgi:hypothetical protein
MWGKEVSLVAIRITVFAGIVPVVWWNSGDSESLPHSALKITPLASDGEFKSCPRLSRGGGRVVYCWGGPEQDPRNLYDPARIVVTELGNTD